MERYQLYAAASNSRPLLPTQLLEFTAHLQTRRNVNSQNLIDYLTSQGV